MDENSKKFVQKFIEDNLNKKKKYEDSKSDIWLKYLIFYNNIICILKSNNIFMVVSKMI